ncbi:DNA-binding protein [Pseudoponticoccus marisrubri]|uniref:KfrA N-terminal DNA-binding domain-containing protein n=1 Tax=Pseudoponticoccus marisrubri TaxID=1685382 RepID=A0A0W7WEX3_9RHOB|nr:DNA-binding protein [Pseudoponticoccus marisrubri]KUF09044.1 hypothetical protein AVJ23_19815 [Pseudoponticoccus marisrubri]
MAQKKSSASLEKQIRDAIRKLTEDGKQITNQTVRDEIGGGSFREIGPLVKQVKAEIAAREKAERAAPEMPEDFHDAAAAMWQTAWQLADEIAASERHAHAAELERLRAEADEALSNCGLVEDERDEAEKRADAAEKMLTEAEAALLDAKFEIARLNGQLTERETYIESRLAEARGDDASEAVSDDEVSAEPKIKVEENPPATENDTQLDMFSKGKTGKWKPDDAEPIAAE